MIEVSQRLRQSMLRMKQAAAGKADCIPVYAQMSHHSAKLAGETTFKFFTDAETFLKCQLHADEFYQFDSPTIHYDCYNIEAEALGAELLWMQDQFPEVDPTAPFLRSMDDIKNLKPVNIGKAGRMPYVLEINQRLIDLGLSPKIRFCGTFSLAAKLLGVENLIMAIISTPAKVHKFMEHLTDEIIAPWITCQRDMCNCNDTATGADAVASPPILTVEMIDEFCLGYIKRLENSVGKIRLAGLWGESLLSDPLKLLDIKRDGCPDMLQALDPDVTTLGPAFYKQYAEANKMALIMGLDAAFIQNATIPQIESRANKFINEAAQDGRFILYINDIPYNTNPEHIKAVVTIGHNYHY